MKKTYSFILFFTLLSYYLFSQITFPWNGTYSGSGANRTYSTTVSGVTMSVTINNSENVFQDASPKFFATGSVFPSSGCSGLPAANEGMLLSTDWTTNTTKTIVVTITFSQPVQAPINFSLYDINDDGSGSWRDKITISASNSIGAVNISKAGTLCIETGGSVSGNNTALLTLNAGSSSACTCWGNNSINVGAATDCVNSIVITYGSSNTSYNNPKQYIVISKLTTTAPGAVTTSTAVTNNCGNSILTATGGGLYNWSNSLGSSSSVNTNTAGTYSVTITNTKGCQKVATVIASPKTNPTASASLNCEQANTIILSGSGGNSYSWSGPNSFSNSTSSTTISSASSSNYGTYNLTVTAANGCTATTSLPVNSTVCSLLPVELTEFNANRINEYVVLNWQTASEINNDYFAIERSLDGTNFQTIDVIKGKGNTYQSVTYQSTDNEPGSDITYYRLKQVDLNGKYTYSKIVAVEASDKEIYISQPVPNPFNDEFSISFQLKNKIEFITEIYDLSGKKVRIDYDIFEPGTSHKFCQLKDYENGIYFFNIKSLDGSSNFNYKLIKN